MAKTDEQKIFAGHIGERANFTKLQSLSRANGRGYGSYADCEEYEICCTDGFNRKQYRRHFHLTSKIAEEWRLQNIDFRIYLYVREGILIGGHIYRYRKTDCATKIGYETDAKRQELRMVDAILTYINLEENSNERKQ